MTLSTRVSLRKIFERALASIGEIRARSDDIRCAIDGPDGVGIGVGVGVGVVSSIGATAGWLLERATAATPGSEIDSDAASSSIAASSACGS